MNNDLIYNIVKQGEGMDITSFLEYIGKEFNLPTHKWSVLDDENTPLFNVDEKIVFNNDGYEIITFDLNSYDNVGHIKFVNYDFLCEHETQNTQCETCQGKGEIFQESGAGIHATANLGWVECPDCNGDGELNVL